MKIPSLFLILISFLHAAPGISDLVISDVSDRSFRVIAHSGDAIEPTVLVYSNAALTNPVASAQSVAWRNLDSLATNLASASGLSIVDVTNLEANTTYYVRLQVRSLADDSVSLSPVSQVKTAVEVTPFSRGNNLAPLANPLLKFHAVNRRGDGPPQIGVLLAEVEGARSPVSTVVRSNETSFLEMQNLIDEGSGRTMPLVEDQTLTLTFYRGDEETETNHFYTTGHANFSEIVSPKLSPGELEQPIVVAAENAVQVFLEFPVIQGEVYELEFSDTLTSASWASTGSRQQALSTRLLWMDFPGSGTLVPPGASSRRFYRIRRLLP